MVPHVLNFIIIIIIIIIIIFKCQIESLEALVCLTLTSKVDTLDAIPRQKNVVGSDTDTFSRRSVWVNMIG